LAFDGDSQTAWQCTKKTTEPLEWVDIYLDEGTNIEKIVMDTWSWEHDVTRERFSRTGIMNAHDGCNVEREARGNATGTEGAPVLHLSLLLIAPPYFSRRPRQKKRQLKRHRRYACLPVHADHLTPRMVSSCFNATQ
jgi:hypothetical protein